MAHLEERIEEGLVFSFEDHERRIGPVEATVEVAFDLYPVVRKALALKLRRDLLRHGVESLAQARQCAVAQRLRGRLLQLSGTSCVS